MQKIAIFQKHLVTYGTVAQDILGQYNLLKNAGFDCHIFCKSATQDFPVSCRPVHEIEQFLTKKEDVLILHEFDKDCFMNWPFRKILRWHGILPINMFNREDFSFINSLSAFESLYEFLKIPHTLILSDSVFAESELPPCQHKRIVLYPFTKKFNFRNTGVKKQILMVGRISKNKRQDIALELSKLMPDYQFNLIGPYLQEGIFVELFNRILNERIQNLDIWGCCTQQIVENLLEESCCLLQCSEHEYFPTSLVDAMQVGIPSIAYNCTSVNEVSKGTSLLYEDNEDIQEIHRLIKLTCQGYENREDAQNQLNQLYEYNYGREKLGQQFMNIMENFLKLNT